MCIRDRIDTAQDYAADPTLQGRIHAAATYFQEQLQPLDAVMASAVTSDNKELKDVYKRQVGNGEIDLRNGR